jgi:Tfp pilus assembly protein PilX
MKTQKRNRRTSDSGSALFITLVIAGVIALTLGAYLTWASTQNKMAVRSQSWNGAMPAAEAGLEEALMQLHESGTTNLSANSWTLTNGWYYKKNYVDNRAFYDVNIQNASPPVIIATGYLPVPLSTSSYVKRRVRVTTVGGTAGQAGVISKGSIYMSGNNVTVDSFVSTNASFSTSNRWDATKARDKGDIITMAHDVTVKSKTTYALDVGDADVKGHVHVIPGATVNMTGSGSVGDSAWVNAGTVGIESGWSSTDANMGIDDNQPPPGPFFSPPAVIAGKVPYNLTFATSGSYQMSSLSGKVLIQGNVTLYVTGDVNIGSGEFIELAPGATLDLYVGGAAKFAGQGVVNDGGLANSFHYYGLPTNTSVDYGGNSAFYGIINAPEADIKLSGGGGLDMDFSGAMVVNSLYINGHYHIHYDEASPPIKARPLVIASWTEIDPNVALY